MREPIALLFELQELELTLAESEILHPSGGEADLQPLRDKIATGRKAVDPELLRRYDLLRRNGLGVAVEASGTCSACNLNVPQGDLNRMRRGQMPWKCSHCGRFLLLSE